MMRWRPFLPVAAAAAAAAASMIPAAGATRAISSRSIQHPASKQRLLLFLRTPPGGVGSRAALGTSAGPASGKGGGSGGGGVGKRPMAPEEAAAAAAAEAPKPSFPARLPTVERMRLLRAQARASEGEDEGGEGGASACPAHGSGHEAVVFAWLRELVIGLKLCPWAAPALNAGAIRVRIHPDDDLEALTQAVLEEAVALAGMPEAAGAKNATVLIGTPRALADFGEFLDFAGVVDDLIDELGLRGKVQLASFHPDYTFADSTPETDVENFTNRSPMPILHLLREVEVSRALDQYPGVPDNIYVRNKGVMREMGKQQLQALIDACRAAGEGK